MVYEEEYYMQEWERLDAIKGFRREIEILKSKRNKLYRESSKINYNTQRGQLQSDKLQRDLDEVDNQIAVCYEEIGELKHIRCEKEEDRKTTIQVTIRNRNRLIDVGEGTYDVNLETLLDFWDENH